MASPKLTPTLQAAAELLRADLFERYRLAPSSTASALLFLWEQMERVCAGLTLVAEMEDEEAKNAKR